MVLRLFHSNENTGRSVKNGGDVQWIGQILLNEMVVKHKLAIKKGYSP